jgi:hypothetical protein
MYVLHGGVSHTKSSVTDHPTRERQQDCVADRFGLNASLLIDPSLSSSSLHRLIQDPISAVYDRSTLSD